ncbi:sensor histidine kinase [Lysinibacillus sp. NPDC097287]|uniref:sensor histidine kinase n=1 Tax=Lysinibacillus sp. NPDC097287 TaxID=3364144 RepID=UPI0037F42AAD
MSFKKFRFHNLNLKTKLLLSYIVITILPTALLGYIAYSQYVLSVERQVGIYVPRLLNQANNNLERQIDQYYDEMGQIYNYPDVINVLRDESYQNVSSARQDLHKVENYLAGNFMEGSRNYIIGAFIASNNRLFEYTKTTFTSGYSTKDKIGLYGNAYNLSNEEQIFFPHETVVQFYDNKPYVLLVKQIVDYENRNNLGTLYVALDLAFMEKTLATVDEQADAIMWMFDQQNYFIYHTDPNLIGSRDTEMANYPLSNGSFQSESILFSSAQSVQNRWTFVHTIPVSHLTEESDFVRNLTIFSFFAIITLAIISSILLAWGVAKPIQRLVKEMKKAEKGDFNIYLPEESDNEVGTLSKAFTKMLHEIEELIDEKYDMELKQKEAELYALQSQINPHFMYNTLENIAFMVEEGEQELVVEMVTNLGRMLRYSLGNRDQMVPLQLELRHADDYLMIQKARFEESLSYHITTNGDVLDNITPKFILQPLIENSLEHGFIAGQMLVIQIQVTERAGIMEIIIEDNGRGMSVSQLREVERKLKMEHTINKEDSFGLTNVNGRLVLHFGNDFRLRIASTEGSGTVITLNIPT